MEPPIRKGLTDEHCSFKTMELLGESFKQGILTSFHLHLGAESTLPNIFQGFKSHVLPIRTPKLIEKHKSCQNKTETVKELYV